MSVDEDDTQMLTWQIGDVRITQIVELTTASLGPLSVAAGDAGSARGDRLDRGRSSTRSSASCSAFTRWCSKRGIDVSWSTPASATTRSARYPRWNHMQGRFLEDFVERGFALDRVDTVLCTHMHVDHVGWNTRLVDGRWEPTFPNARYLFAEKEWQHWSREPQEYGPVIEDSVQPIFDRGLADLVGETHRVTDEISLEPTPGHTPGHVSVHITSRGEEAVITGDMIHHPCQIVHPQWSSSADVDPFAAATTREHFLRVTPIGPC